LSCLPDGLMEVKYDESKTKVDFCKMCGGVWLDRGEFKQIINYLKINPITKFCIITQKSRIEIMGGFFRT